MIMNRLYFSGNRSENNPACNAWALFQIEQVAQTSHQTLIKNALCALQHSHDISAGDTAGQEAL